MLRLKCLVVVCAGLVLSGFALAAPADDALKANGLAAAGSAYVLSDELDVLKDMPAVRKAKKEFDADARIRHGQTLKITASKAFITQSEKEYDQLKDRLTVITDAKAHNRIVLRMNQLVIKIKESEAGRKDAEEQLAKADVTLGTNYVDSVLALDAKAQAATKKYANLAADTTVKSAIDKANRSASSPLALGPSADFVTAAAELAKYRSAIDSEAIPVTEEGGVWNLTVLLNGQPFKMTFDPGATFVTLPREMAEKVGLVPGPKDPTIELKLGDGHIIQVQQMTLKTIRAGRFTLESVSCVVMAPGLRDAGASLGNSFLSHFVAKLDQKAGELHLTEVDTGDKKSASPGAVPTEIVKPSGK